MPHRNGHGPQSQHIEPGRSCPVGAEIPIPPGGVNQPLDNGAWADPRLRNYARNKHPGLTDVAAALVDGTLSVDAVAPTRRLPPRTR